VCVCARARARTRVQVGVGIARTRVQVGVGINTLQTIDIERISAQFVNGLQGVYVANKST